MNFKKLCIKNWAFYYSDDIIKLQSFDFDVLGDENSQENILICKISCETLIGPYLRIRFMMELEIY